MQVWTNRKLNIKEYNRKKYEGWQYQPTKVLDLDPLTEYNELKVFEQKPTILHKVDLHEELPKNVIIHRHINLLSEAEDYNIRAMVNWLKQVHPEDFPKR